MRSATRWAQSTAMSQPELPDPTTSTRDPATSSGDRYVAECSWRPVNPGRLGWAGSCRWPFATTTAA